MRSTSVISPILTLNYDALSEVAQRLHGVGSTKPWRDANSLAFTCKVFLKWKERKVNAQIKAEWLRVNLTISARSGWRKGLKSIIGDYENSPTRLFREPILRKTATKVKPLTKGYETEGYEDFITQIFLCREIVTLKEIQDCLSVIRRSELPKQSRVLSKLPEFLPSLSSAHRQEVLRSMFEILDRDWHLGSELQINSIFDQINDALGDDPESKSLLCLGLHYLNLDSSYPDEKKLASYLKCIPNEKRWSWILDSVPECLTTKLGMRIMLNDPACRDPMIDFLNTSFLKCKDDFERIKVCELVSTVYSKLCECNKGKSLTKNMVHWFLKTQPLTSGYEQQLSTKYVNLLIEHINLVKICFGEKERELLSKAMYKAIRYAFQICAYNQSTSILIALAKDDIELFKKIIINNCDIYNKETLLYILNYSSFASNIENGSKIIKILRTSVFHHNSFGRSFVRAFTQMADEILKQIADFEKEIEDVGSTASES